MLQPNSIAKNNTNLVVGTTDVLLTNTTITIISSCNIAAIGTAIFSNTSGNATNVTMYIKIDNTLGMLGETSIMIGDSQETSVTIFDRTNTSLPSGSYIVGIYGRSSLDSGINLLQASLMTLGNLT